MQISQGQGLGICKKKLFSLQLFQQKKLIHMYLRHANKTVVKRIRYSCGVIKMMKMRGEVGKKTPKKYMDNTSFL